MTIKAEDFGSAPWSVERGWERRREVLIATLKERGWYGIGADDKKVGED